MKPSDFILNSDYLSIAQTQRKTYDVYFGGGSLLVNGDTYQTVDFNTPPQQGAIDRILIQKDGGNWFFGSYMTLTPSWDGTNQVVGFIGVSRPNKNTLRVEFYLQNYGSGTSTYPSMTFKIKVSTFRPPNVF